jgi:hypothetical protein
MNSEAQPLTRNTNSLRKSWIIVKPPVKGSKNILLSIAVVGFSMIPLFTFPVLFEAIAANRHQSLSPCTLAASSARSALQHFACSLLLA